MKKILTWAVSFLAAFTLGIITTWGVTTHYQIPAEHRIDLGIFACCVIAVGGVLFLCTEHKQYKDERE